MARGSRKESVRNSNEVKGSSSSSKTAAARGAQEVGTAADSTQTGYDWHKKRSAVMDAQEHFRAATAEEFNRLCEAGQTREVATSNLLLRISPQASVPTEEQISELTKRYTMSREDAVRALIVKEEIARLRESGLNTLSAIQVLTRRVSSDYANRMDVERWRKEPNLLVGSESNMESSAGSASEVVSGKEQVAGVDSRHRNTPQKVQHTPGRSLESQNETALKTPENNNSYHDSIEMREMKSNENVRSTSQEQNALLTSAGRQSEKFSKESRTRGDERELSSTGSSRKRFLLGGGQNLEEGTIAAIKRLRLLVNEESSPESFNRNGVEDVSIGTKECPVAKLKRERSSDMDTTGAPSKPNDDTSLTHPLAKRRK